MLKTLKPPEHSILYKVVVVPVTNLACWQFLILIHKDDNPIFSDVIGQVCESILDVGDKYYIMPTEDANEDLELGIPIMSFDEDDPECFDWIIAPARYHN